MIFERGHFDSTIAKESLMLKAFNKTRLFESVRPTYSSKPTVFLSHKHSDLNDLEGVMGMLEKLDVEIYIDSMDKTMPNQTCADTAHRIKDVIKYCRKFVLLATEKAIESYWCNWELGFGDTHKYIENIAILPIKEKGGYDFQYKGNEYLQIYPQIDYYKAGERYNTGALISEGYYVCQPRDKNGTRVITPLRNWLYS